MPDNDPFEPLDNFPEGLHVNALPASEVRRRGDRMRRRNTAFATVGGVVAAAVFIGVPVALMNGDDKDTVDPAPQPPTPTATEDAEPEWITEIPQDFPLKAGMVTGDGTVFEGDLDAFPLCEMAYPTSPGTSETRTVSFSNDGESSVTRTFQLWPDDVTADASLDELVAGVQACPQQPSAGGEDVVETKLVDYANGGDRMVTFAQQYVADDGLLSQLTTVQVTRVGNAVLVNSTYGSAGGDEAIEVATQILDERSQATRGAMCVFSADPCAEAPEPSESGSSGPASAIVPIPADFPLADGLDDSADTDVEGPGTHVEAGRVFDVCGTDIWSPDGLGDRLAVRETGPEYLEARELDIFPTADEPIEEMTMVRDAVRDCPRIEGESYGYTIKVLDGPEGYDSVTWGAFADEGLDGGVYQITRVGSSVFVLYAAGEMSESSLQPTADNLTETTLALAPEMCLFTEDGC